MPYGHNPIAERSVALMTEETFVATLSRAAEGDLSLVELIDAATSVSIKGDDAKTDLIYRTWLAHNGNHPSAYAARFNFAVALADRGALHQARDMLLSALAQKPDFAPACINLGSVLERANNRPGAIAAWQRITEQFKHVDGESVAFKTTALNQIARVLETAKIEAPAEAAMRASLGIDPLQRDVIQHLIALRQAQCTWPTLQDSLRLDSNQQLESISPLSLAAQVDDPILQLANANRYHTKDAQSTGFTTAGHWPPPESKTPRPLRIGYVSSDMREHAVGYLMAQVFSLHDRQRVEVFAYYCGPDREDELKSRFRASADHWREIGHLTDRQAAALIVQDHIDILVDVNGYTKDGRVKLFGYRPAPIIVNWLGFPGSLGTPHHHYIIADANIIPECDEMFYAERVARLPCYQPNDVSRNVAVVGQTREEAGLPPDAFVFCGFNGSHKITPALFTLWMTILRETPESVLWLLCDSEETRARLRIAAIQDSVDPKRLIFAGRLNNAEHLARYRLADLFLDTAPYGAHTTASDALWMGVPVLTRAGNGFAARVCASLVREAGIPDIVCDDWTQYRTRAVEYANSPDLLHEVAARLRSARDTCTLFDTPKLVRSLEDIFQNMWQDYCEGRLPRPELRHLPLYQRIGCDAAQPALPERTGLLARYHTSLLYANAVEVLPADPLLWRDRMPDCLPAPSLAA